MRIISSLWNNFKEYVVLVILILISVVILSQNKSKGIQTVKTIAFGTFASVTSLVNDIFNVSSLKKENQTLRKTNAELMLQVSRLREYGITNNELKSLLAFRDSTNFPLISATAVSKSLSKSQGTITINAGKLQGVKSGMPIVTDKGLAGIVYSVSDNYSIARTLENVDLKITVKCERSRENAVMKWNGDQLVLINVPKTFDIRKGDRVVTSELSTIVPIPLPVGVVTEIANVEEGIFNEVKLNPFVDFQKLEYVFVLQMIKSKEIDNMEFNFLNR